MLANELRPAWLSEQYQCTLRSGHGALDLIVLTTRTIVVSANKSAESKDRVVIIMVSLATAV